jgi:septum formation protein
MKLPPLILASQSPRRQLLLREITNDFDVVKSDAEELHDPGIPPKTLCELNATLKAQPIGVQYPNHLVLAADTLVFLDGHPLGKPLDLDEARRMLRSLSGKNHQVITGVCLLHEQVQRQVVFSVTTQVWFRPLTDSVIEEYLAQVNVLDKAGAYALQEHGERLVERVEGSASNVIGLPLEALRDALEAWDGNER